ncbi:hypothetical protein HLB44_25135 [Aquincola sp. S2]|uniref:PEP-CTERM protein-sorting domain-containing protein n=1 Tax=Pseudaquabacterium terrae TaxID=2732868 RepID=A0ABX2ENU6_9BURK|nr:hypothetical protein [Aquabacterium terrae]NRF70298.1 hypothetical protein [Aquabacterium terrae]
MNLRNNLLGAVVLVAALCGSTAAHALAAPVSCAGPPGLRILTIDPALVGGLCHTQEGNLQPADITALGLDLYAKENVGGPSEDPFNVLDFTMNGAGTSGTWTIAASVWALFNEVYLGFHFGGGGQGDESNPDSFIVQLSPSDLTGTWLLDGLPGVKLNALSHIDLIVCQASAPDCEGGGGGGGGAPEPASWLLAAIGLAVVGGLRRIAARVPPLA